MHFTSSFVSYRKFVNNQEAEPYLELNEKQKKREKKRRYFVSEAKQPNSEITFSVLGNSGKLNFVNLWGIFFVSFCFLLRMVGLSSNEDRKESTRSTNTYFLFLSFFLPFVFLFSFLFFFFLRNHIFSDKKGHYLVEVYACCEVSTEGSMKSRVTYKKKDRYYKRNI